MAVEAKATMGAEAVKMVAIEVVGPAVELRAVAVEGVGMEVESRAVRGQ